MANSVQYIVGANCFAPKIYCIELAVGKKVEENLPVWRKQSLFQIYCVVLSFLDAQGNNTESDILARKFHFTGR
jgi:hypothetical protein